MHVWDTAGQESFRSITKIFYRGAHVVMLAYSIINGMTFENLSDWLREVRTQCSPDVMVYIVGNKADLEEMREVHEENVLQFKEMNNIHYFIETSAKSGANVETLFTDCSRFLYLKYKHKMNEVSTDGDSSNYDSSYYNTNINSRSGSFRESGGHRVTRRKDGARKLKPLRGSKQKRNCKC